MLMPGAALPATLSTSGISTPVLSQGQALEAAVSQGISQKDTTFTKIFVGGLPYHTTDKSLREHFEVYGDIEEAVVITDRQTGKSRGYGFVTMADKGGADRAIKEPNPVIDGRKANVNLAYLGAKPRGPAADASSSLLLRQVAATQPYFATTQLLQQRAAFQPVNMAAAAGMGNMYGSAAAAGMTTHHLRYPIPSPTMVAGGTGTMPAIEYGIQTIADPSGVGTAAVTAAASSTTTGDVSALADSPSGDYGDFDDQNSGIPLTGVRYPAVNPSIYGEPGPGSAGGVVRTPRASHTFSPYTSFKNGNAYWVDLDGGNSPSAAYGVIPSSLDHYSKQAEWLNRIHPNYVYHPSFMQTAAGLLPMAATAPIAHAGNLAATQAYYDYAAQAATAAYPAAYPTAATASALEPYATAAAVSAGTQQGAQAITPGTAASAMYGTAAAAVPGYSWQQAAAAQAAAAAAGNIPLSYATQPQIAQEAARMQ